LTGSVPDSAYGIRGLLYQLTGKKGYTITDGGRALAGPAPHREDAHHSFSVFQGVDGEWLVHDFAQPLANGKHTMRLRDFLRVYFGIGEGKEEKRRIVDTKPPSLRDRVVSYTLMRPIPKGDEKEVEELAREIKENGEPYLGHGFGKWGIDSRKYGIFVYYGKPHLLIGGRDGIEAVKLRTGDERGKYRFAAGNAYWTLYGNPDADTAIVIEGEMKAVAVAELVGSKAAVFAALGKSNLHKVPVLGYKKIVYVLDSDAHKEMRDGRLVQLNDVLLYLWITGNPAQIIPFPRVVQLAVEELGLDGVDLFKTDINDLIEFGATKTQMRKWLKEAARLYIPNPDHLKNNYPVVDVSDLSPSAAHLYSLMPYLIARQMGEFVSRNKIEFEIPVLDMVKLTGLPKSTAYDAMRELRDVGLVSYKHGMLHQFVRQPRRIIVDYKRLVSRFIVESIEQDSASQDKEELHSQNDDDHQTTPWPTGVSYYSFPRFASLGNPKTAPVNRMFDRHNSYRFIPSTLNFAAYLSHTTNTENGIGKGVLRKLKETVLDPGRVVAAAAARQFAWHEFLRKYTATRNAMLDIIRRFMRGTYIFRNFISNRRWKDGRGRQIRYPVSLLSDREFVEMMVGV